MSSQHPQDVLLAQFSLYLHKNGLKPDRFHLYFRFFAYERVAGPTTEPIPENTANTIPPTPSWPNTRCDAQCCYTFDHCSLTVTDIQLTL